MLLRTDLGDYYGSGTYVLRPGFCRPIAYIRNDRHRYLFLNYRPEDRIRPDLGWKYILALLKLPAVHLKRRPYVVGVGIKSSDTVYRHNDGLVTM